MIDRNLVSLAGAVCVAVAVAVFPASGQDRASPPAGGEERRHPASNPAAVANQPPRGQSYLERRYGISRAEADRRMASEDEVSALAGQLVSQHPKDFIGSVIEHQPNYRVTLVFSSDVSLQAIKVDISPSLRSSLRVRRSKYTAQAIEETEASIRAILQPLGQSYSLSYDLKSDKFVITTDPESERIKVNLFPAELRPDISIRRAGSPGLMQTGVQPGDSIYGGWTMLGEDNQDKCTFGFVVRDSSAREGITTAAHCPTVTKVGYEGGRTVTLPAPFEDRLASGDDFRAHHTTGMTTGPWSWYWNNLQGTYRVYLGTAGYETRQWANVHPEYNVDSGYFYVVGAVTGTSRTNPNHPVGAVRCKNGRTTGITCGEITSSSTDTSRIRNGQVVYYYNYVEVAYSDQMVLAYGGDSGGPVFTRPVWNPNQQLWEIRAAGLVVSGNDAPSGNDRRPCVSTEDPYCYYHYLPIDRINDRVPMQIITSVGGVSP